MARISLLRGSLSLGSLLALLVSPAASQDALYSTSLISCQENSLYTASLFNVVFTPNNDSIAVTPNAMSSISSYVKFDITAYAVGYPFIHMVVDPCKTNLGLAGMCPMSSGRFNTMFRIPVPGASKSVPGIAYTLPDLDARVRIYINATSGDLAGRAVSCIEAKISNGKTVDLIGVKWATAAVAALALSASAVLSHLGHQNAASHVATNAMSLFGYFQAQAMVGMCAMPLPPIVQSWTQDFQWSMGVIEVGFIQNILTWYQRATSGTPTMLLSSLGQWSVQVQKRSLPGSPVADTGLVKRGNIQTDYGYYIVYGLQRVAFRAGIESTNLFMTGLTFFLILMALAALGVMAFRAVVGVILKQRASRNWSEQTLEFRDGWPTILKGILFRVTLIGFPAIAVLSLWELTQNDSPAEMVLAVCFFLGVTASLVTAVTRVIRIASRSVAFHGNPAYVLFSDRQALNKLGFLYIPYRASCYYFIAPVLGHTLLKAVFLAFAQRSGIAQAIGFLLLEAAAVIATSTLRPWMDKSTNAFNISICVVNFINAICLLMFTEVFGQPPIVTSVTGLVFWVINAAFTLVLLLMIIASTIATLVRNNPDSRYVKMNDDRTSFLKSQTQLVNTELDALGAVARGEKTGFASGSLVDLDRDERMEPARRVPPSFSANSMRDRRRSLSIRGHTPTQDIHSVPPSPRLQDRGGSSSSMDVTAPGGYRAVHNVSPLSNRPMTPTSRWQRGAGYD